MKKKIVSVVVVIIILILILGIWIIKSNNRNKDIQQQIENSKEVNEDFKLEINSRTVNIEKLKSYNIPIIIDFGSDSCIPCKQMAPALKQLNEEMQGKAIIKFADVWKNLNIANGYPVELIPTQIFINSDGTPYVPKNAEELELNIVKDNEGNHIFTTHIGALTVEEMKSILKEMGLNE